ncbi:MAG: hypothetical protein ACUVQO_06375 [Leptodesmis sp.]
MFCSPAMRSLDNHGFLAQTQPAQAAPTLVNLSGQHLIYIGVGLMAIAIVIVLGLLNRRLDAALLFALLISAIIVVLVLVA